MTRHELEAALEQRCVARIEALGGLALKLTIPGVRGFPDRTVLMPKTHRYDDSHDYGWLENPVFFLEFKRIRTGRVSAQQHRWRALLHGLGFRTFFIDSDAQFDAALKEMGL